MAGAIAQSPSKFDPIHTLSLRCTPGRGISRNEFPPFDIQALWREKQGNEKILVGSRSYLWRHGGRNDLVPEPE
jgi:hypothetical protein